MKYLIAIVALVTLQASVCAEDFSLTKLNKAKPTVAAKAVQPAKLDCSSGTCVLADGVGDGNNAVAKKEAVVAAPTRRWGITGYKRVGWFRRQPVYGWTSTPTKVRSTGSCASGSCSTGRR